MEIVTEYGVLKGCITPEYYENGNLKSCRFDKENNILTEIGLLTPQYEDENVRRKFNNAISFYKSGSLNSISLDKQTNVLTPVGRLAVELVTFYENGLVKRVFPLNGKISGYWSENDEAELASPIKFVFDFGIFTAKIMCIYFYESGNIKSVTLFPNELINIKTPIGDMEIRTGFSLYESGKLKSVEPAKPIKVNTLIGELTAFDTSAIGITADNNSITFDEEGNLASVSISNEQIIVRKENNEVEVVKPIIQRNPMNEEEFFTIPFKVIFKDGIVKMEDDTKHSYNLEGTTFTVISNGNLSSCSSCSSCAGCSSCK